MKDLGSAFSFPFKDPQWVLKLALGMVFVLLSFFLVGVLFMIGYLIQTTQRVMRREQYPLPAWDGLSAKFVLGAKFLLVLFAYLIPVALLLVPVLALTIAGGMSDNPDVFGAFSVVYSFGVTLLLVPYGLALTVILPIIIYRFADRERIGDAVDVAAIVRDFRHNWQNTVLVALLAAAVQSFSGVGALILIIGVLFTTLYAYLISAYLVGALAIERGEARGTA